MISTESRKPVVVEAPQPVVDPIDVWRTEDQPLSAATKIRLAESITIRGSARGASNGQGAAFAPQSIDSKMTFKDTSRGILVYSPPGNGHKAEKVLVPWSNILEISWLQP